MFGDSFYRFELVRDGWLVQDQFNFVLPPIDMATQGTYRGAIVKTFGGTHVDVVRMDNLTMTIQGTTGGPKIRRDWGKRLPEGNGVDMLKYFRDNIWRYPEHPRYGKIKDKLTVRFWDIELEESYWVHITNFQYRKSKDKPVGGWYDFTITMSTIDPPTNMLLDAFAFLKALKDFKDAIQGVLNAIQDTIDLLDALLQVGMAFVEAGVGFATACMDLASATFAEMGRVLTMVRTTTQDLFDVARQAVSSLDNLATSMRTLREEGRITFGGEFGDSCEKNWNDLATYARQTVLNFRQTTQTNRRLDSTTGSSTTVTPATTTAGLTSRTDLDTQRVNQYPGSQGNVVGEADAPPDGLERAWQRASHTVEHTVQLGETLSDIAEEFYGDSRYTGPLIEYNELTTADLPAGQKLRVPLYQENAPLFNNLVFDRAGDQYGKDLLLSPPGFLAVSSQGTLAITKAALTVEQALQNRLSFVTGDLRSNKQFGFPVEATVGRPSTVEAQKLVRSKVRMLIEEDPRVESFEPLQILVDKDVIQIDGTVFLAEGLSIPVSLKLV